MFRGKGIISYSSRHSENEVGLAVALLGMPCQKEVSRRRLSFKPDGSLPHRWPTSRCTRREGLRNRSLGGRQVPQLNRAKVVQKLWDEYDWG